jgi:hypothetical protein
MMDATISQNFLKTEINAKLYELLFERYKESYIIYI